MEANEEKRKEYQEVIKGIDSRNIVYIHESGIELKEVKDRSWDKKGKILKANS